MKSVHTLLVGRELSTIVEGQRAWNSTHHWRYVFQTAFLSQKHIQLHVRVRVRVCFFCCVVPCHVVCRASLLVGWLGVVWCCRQVVVVVVFVLVPWSLSLRRHRKNRKKKKEQERRREGR